MNAVSKDETKAVDQHNTGLYHKFNAEYVDGSSAPGGRHHGDDLFVLNLTTDPHAMPALKAYAKSCANGYPALAADLRAKIRATLPSEFVTVPETTLPNGLIVPAFEVSRFLCTVADGKATVQADAVPTVDINYHDAVKACDAAELKLIRETQALAIAWNIYNVDANWAGGKVGEGDLRQGLHNGSVGEAQSNDYESDDSDEDRRFYLSNGAVIYDAAGHLYTWVFDDVQGDEHGIVASKFATDSISTTTCPDDSMERGTGWRPSSGANWSGSALLRGGRWVGGDRAGVFFLYSTHPGFDYVSVGFRSTK